MMIGYNFLSTIRVLSRNFFFWGGGGGGGEAQVRV